MRPDGRILGHRFCPWRKSQDPHPHPQSPLPSGDVTLLNLKQSITKIIPSSLVLNKKEKNKGKGEWISKEGT